MGSFLHHTSQSTHQFSQLLRSFLYICLQVLANPKKKTSSGLLHSEAKWVLEPSLVGSHFLALLHTLGSDRTTALTSLDLNIFVSSSFLMCGVLLQIYLLTRFIFSSPPQGMVCRQVASRFLPPDFWFPACLPILLVPACLTICISPIIKKIIKKTWIILYADGAAQPKGLFNSFYRDMFYRWLIFNGKYNILVLNLPIQSVMSCYYSSLFSFRQNKSTNVLLAADHYWLRSEMAQNPTNLNHQTHHNTTKSLQN